MNEFDQFIKHKLHIKHYARYTDDFAIVSVDREYLESLLVQISDFLRERLALELHPKKVSIRKFHQGIDFLGYVAFPNHRLIRTKTQQRIFKKFQLKIEAYHAGFISEEILIASLQSYLGVLSHADARRLEEKLKNMIWFQ